MGVILYVLLIKVTVYGDDHKTKQRQTHQILKLDLDSERSALRMGMDVCSGYGLCLLLMITRGALA